MKSVLLAIVFFVTSIFFSFILLRAEKDQKYLRSFLAAYVGAVFGYTVLFLISPKDVGFLPPQLIESNPMVGFWNGLLLFSLLFHCFVDVTYTTALTGFAANLLILIAEYGFLTQKQIEEMYRINQMEDQIISRRLKSLKDACYIEEKGTTYRLRPKGLLIAWVSKYLQKLYRTSEGG